MSAAVENDSESKTVLRIVGGVSDKQVILVNVEQLAKALLSMNFNVVGRTMLGMSQLTNVHGSMPVTA